MKERFTLTLFVAAVAGVGGPSPVILAGNTAKETVVTYDEHIRPIFRDHCFTCHNQNTAKSTLR